MYQSGGILAHFSSLSLGRALVTERSGTLLAVIKAMPYVLLFWYAVTPRIGETIRFWLLVLCTVSFNFIATGSRSSILIAVLTILLATAQVKGKLPKGRLAMLALVGTVILGTLGEFRQSAARNSGVVDLSILKNMINVQDALGSTRNSTTESDNVRGDLAIFLSVPEDVGYLGGESYLGSLGFFIPRSIWPTKPRSSGAFVGSKIYDRIDDHSTYKGAGYPTGGAAEAYWNFGWFGIVVIFAVFGMFSKFMVGWFLCDHHDPRRLTVFILTLVNFNSPSSETLSIYMQSLFVVAALSPFVTMSTNQGTTQGQPA
jgi:oligosaccharide repeat unit polymerase